MMAASSMHNIINEDNKNNYDTLYYILEKWVYFHEG